MFAQTLYQAELYALEKATFCFRSDVGLIRLRIKPVFPVTLQGVFKVQVDVLFYQANVLKMFKFLKLPSQGQDNQVANILLWVNLVVLDGKNLAGLSLN